MGRALISFTETGFARVNRASMNGFGQRVTSVRVRCGHLTAPTVGTLGIAPGILAVDCKTAIQARTGVFVGVRTAAMEHAECQRRG